MPPTWPALEPFGLFKKDGSLDEQALHLERVRRARVLDTGARDGVFRSYCVDACRRDPVFFFDQFAWTYDPRIKQRLPMVLWPKQRDFIRLVEACIASGEDFLCEKARDVGVTYLMGGYAICKWRFDPGFKTTFCANKLDLVDEIGNPDSIFEKLRIMLRCLPRWFMPIGFSWVKNARECRLINPENGNVITGEGGDNAGRGGRSTLFVADEAAHIDRADKVNAATSANANTRAWVSSVNGNGNLFYRMRHGGEIKVFTFHWAQPVDANVLTPAGWKKMGDLVPGDRVIGRDGRAKGVLAVHPQGRKDVFRVRFSDGASTECCADHLWSIIPEGNHRAGRKHLTRVLPLSAMIEDYAGRDDRGYRRHRYQIPIAAQVEFDQVGDLPLDPYVLGCLLGDGSFAKKDTRPIVLTVAHEDAELLALVAARLPLDCSLKFAGGIHYRIACGSSHRGGSDGRGHRNPVNAAVRKLGLAGRESHDKFVPEPYLLATPGDRLDLLQGLMDTDGSLSRSQPGIARLTTVSEALAQGVRFVAQSLGGVATLREAAPARRAFPGNREHDCRQAYSVEVRLPDGILPFKLARKVATYVPSRKYQPRRSIVGVEPIGVKDCRCIEVDAPDGLYLTDDCIVTHNSDDPRKNEAWAKARRAKIGRTAFAQEYDIDYGASVEGIAIPRHWIDAAITLRKRLAEKIPALAEKKADAGMDIGAGKAESVVCVRRGPIVYPPITRLDSDTIDVAHWALDHCRSMNAGSLAYDNVGVGFGISAVVKRAQNLDMAVMGVNTGEPPSDNVWPDERSSKDKFGNLKAELWWIAREAFCRSYDLLRYLDGDPEGIDYPAEEVLLMCDDAELASQLSTPKIERTGSGKIMIESKAKLAARGIKSPDRADAFVLTFASMTRPLFYVGGL